MTADAIARRHSGEGASGDETPENADYGKARAVVPGEDGIGAVPADGSPAGSRISCDLEEKDEEGAEEASSSRNSCTLASVEEVGVDEGKVLGGEREEWGSDVRSIVVDRHESIVEESGKILMEVTACIEESESVAPASVLEECSGGSEKEGCLAEGGERDGVKLESKKRVEGELGLANLGHPDLTDAAGYSCAFGESAKEEVVTSSSSSSPMKTMSSEKGALNAVISSVSEGGVTDVAVGTLEESTILKPNNSEEQSSGMGGTTAEQPSGTIIPQEVVVGLSLVPIDYNGDHHGESNQHMSKNSSNCTGKLDEIEGKEDSIPESAVRPGDKGLGGGDLLQSDNCTAEEFDDGLLKDSGTSDLQVKNIGLSDEILKKGSRSELELEPAGALDEPGIEQLQAGRIIESDEPVIREKCPETYLVPCDDLEGSQLQNEPVKNGGSQFNSNDSELETKPIHKLESTQFQSREFVDTVCGCGSEIDPTHKLEGSQLEEHAAESIVAEGHNHVLSDQIEEGSNNEMELVDIAQSNQIEEGSNKEIELVDTANSNESVIDGNGTAKHEELDLFDTTQDEKAIHRGSDSAAENKMEHDLQTAENATPTEVQLPPAVEMSINTKITLLASVQNGEGKSIKANSVSNQNSAAARLEGSDLQVCNGDFSNKDLESSVVDNSGADVSACTIIEENTHTPENSDDEADIMEDDEHLINDFDVKPVHEKVEVDKTHAAPVDLTSSISEVEKMETQNWIGQKQYIVKVPRFAPDESWSEIQNAYSKLDEKTQSRDLIRLAIQKQKNICASYRGKLEDAKEDERAARSEFHAMKNQLSRVQSVINKLNKSNSILEIDEMIQMKNRSLNHETLSLKEERLLIQQIKDLNTQRRLICSNLGSKAEIGEALDQKEQIFERQKSLRWESDILFDKLKHTEERTRVAQKDFDDQQEILRKLYNELGDADRIRQDAYENWSHLKNKSAQKNKYFVSYKKLQRAASQHTALGDMEGLVSSCNKQVEEILDLWNNNEDFRRQYVDANILSTLRRLGTLDGRALGHDEVPPALPPSVTDRFKKSLPVVPDANPPELSLAVDAKSVSSNSPAPPTDEKLTIVQVSNNVKHPKLKAEIRKEKADTGSPSKMLEISDPKENDLNTDDHLELDRKVKELAEKEEEERRKEEKAAYEKERLRLEQIAKAKEAEERKKRKAEKAREKAEYKAKKENEEKQKKKEKKDRKKGSTYGDAGSSADGSCSALNHSDGNEAEISEVISLPAAVPKASKNRPLMKHIKKMEPVPLPLRNRGRRKMLKSWMMAALALLSALVMFAVATMFPSQTQLLTSVRLWN